MYTKDRDLIFAMTIFNLTRYFFFFFFYADWSVNILRHNILCTCLVVVSMDHLKLALGYFCKLDALKNTQ